MRDHNCPHLFVGCPCANGICRAPYRLHEVLRLLEDVELLADDAATLVGADVIKTAIKDLHFQQASITVTFLISCERVVRWPDGLFANRTRR